MAVRCATCGLVAYYTPDRCPRCGGEAFDETQADAGSPPTVGNGAAVVVGLLVVVAMMCVVAGVLVVGIDGEPREAKFLGFMTAIALASLCLGMVALLVRRPES